MFLISPDEVTSNAAAAAAWLRKRNVRPGDRVAMPGQNDPRLLYLTHGALRTEIIPVIVNPSLSETDRDYVLSDCDPALIVRSLDEIDWNETKTGISDVPLGRPMLSTSGTTGTPKGVWGGVLSDDLARAMADDEHELWQPERCVLVCSPLYHSAGHRLATAALLAGASVLLMERFDANEVVSILRDNNVSATFLTPTHLRRIFALGDPPPLSNALRALHAGEPCPLPLKQRALRCIPNLWEFYGSTEGQFSAISPQDWIEHPGSVGRARHMRTLRIDEPGEDGVGTVYVSAPPFARWEYWNDATRTALAWRENAFTVGDLGRLDDNGYLYLSSRREDLIISGGVNVYPAMIESALMEHPSVREVAVFGVEDAEWGQRVCAAIISDDFESVSTFVQARLSGPARPKHLYPVDALPRTPTGKIDRNALRHLTN